MMLSLRYCRTSATMPAAAKRRFLLSSALLLLSFFAVVCGSLQSAHAAATTTTTTDKFGVEQEDVGPSVLAPNFMSPEVNNLLFLLLLLMLILWLVRMVKMAIESAELSVSLKASAMQLLNIINFDRLEAVWAEEHIRNYVEKLLGDAKNIRSPSIHMNQLIQVVQINKDSIRVTDSAGSGSGSSASAAAAAASADTTMISATSTKKFGIRFKFDAIKDCSIQLVWGLRDDVWRDKILAPYRGLAAAASAASTTTTPTTPLSPFDIELQTMSTQDEQSPILQSGDYLRMTRPRVCSAGLNQIFDLSLDELLTEQECEQLMRGLPVSAPSSSGNSSRRQRSESSASPQPTSDVQTSVDEEARIPLLIIAKTVKSRKSLMLAEKEILVSHEDDTSSAEKPLLSRDNDDEEDDDDTEHSLATFTICYFNRFTKSDTSPSQGAASAAAVMSPGAKRQQAIGYSAQAYKQVITTKSNIYLLEDVYGADPTDQNSSEECVICLCDNREVTLLPCRHLCVCEDCFGRIDKCPICRSTITSFVLSKASAAAQHAPGVNGSGVVHPIPV